MTELQFAIAFIVYKPPDRKFIFLYTCGTYIYFFYFYDVCIFFRRDEGGQRYAVVIVAWNR